MAGVELGGIVRLLAGKAAGECPCLLGDEGDDGQHRVRTRKGAGAARCGASAP